MEQRDERCISPFSQPADACQDTQGVRAITGLFSFQGAVQEVPPMGMGKQTPLGETSLPLQRQRSREQITDC